MGSFYLSSPIYENYVKYYFGQPGNEKWNMTSWKRCNSVWR